MKYGLDGLTRVAALDHETDGIRVNAVAAGPALRADEVAAAVVWLCSDPAACVTGTTLSLAGGTLAGELPFQSTRSARPGLARATL